MRHRAALGTTGVWSIPETRARPRRTAAWAESACAAVSARDLASELENRLTLNNFRRAGWRLGYVLLHPLPGAARRLLRPGPIIAGRDGGQFRPVTHGIVGDEAGNAAQQLLDLLAPARQRVGECRGVAPTTNHDVHRAPPETSVSSITADLVGRAHEPSRPKRPQPGSPFTRPATMATSWAAGIIVSEVSKA